MTSSQTTHCRQQAVYVLQNARVPPHGCFERGPKTTRMLANAFTSLLQDDLFQLPQQLHVHAMMALRLHQLVYAQTP